MSKSKRLYTLAIFCIILCYSFASFAQQSSPVIKKSDQKIIYKGKIYYIHKVAKGNTLYSICKTYRVTAGDIKKANPSAILDPLSIGQTLRIPESDDDQKIVADADSENDDFILHTVQAGETSYSLHKKYNVPLPALFKYNPGTEAGLTLGQQVRIPKEHLLRPPVTQPEVKQEDQIRYTVQQGDTLYRIAKNHGVPVSAIVSANEELRWGLKAGQVITIPAGSDESDLAGRTVSDSLFLLSGMRSLSAMQCDSISRAYRMNTPVKIALVLPFFSKKEFSYEFEADHDTLDQDDVHKKQNKFKGRVAIEFYEGLLLAIDSLKKSNIDINLFVYDTEADTNKMKKIIEDLEIIQPDLILGPFLPENIELTNKFSTEKKVPFVPPLMKNDFTLKHNPNLFQVIPSGTDELALWSEYLSQYRTKNILYIHKPKRFRQTESVQFRNILLEKLKRSSGTDSLRFSEIQIDDSLQTNLMKNLSDSLENIVIVASSYEPEVSDVLSKVHFLHMDYEIKVFGLPAWQKFKSVRIEQFHDLNVTIYSPFYIDYSDPLVKTFVLKCRSKLKYEPFMTTSKGTGINYTFLGFDMAMYFISALEKYGEHTCDCAPFFQPGLLLSHYTFFRNRIYGFNENLSLSIVSFEKDLSVHAQKLTTENF
ncbi:MAG: LysM peptidoglycan-binding domain-containing protein [Bacteroidales bacterium]|jgi:LysM repeat protein